MDGTRVCGVELADGERLDAATVVSNADPKTTVMDLLGMRHVEADFAHRIKQLPFPGQCSQAAPGAGRAARLPRCEPGSSWANGWSSRRRWTTSSGPSIPASTANFRANPVAEITIPTVHDPSLAPAGQHVLSAIVQYAPRELRSGWAEGKAAFTEVVMDLLAAYAPDIRERTVATELLTPEDHRSGNSASTGGHWHHGELSLDQFLMLRPVPKSAQYRTPVDGLYLCGAGCHPGGGVMGSAGRNAAQAILAP